MQVSVGVFARLRLFFRRRRHRPTFFQQEIAKRTGETPFDVYERHREAAMRTPFTTGTIEEIDLVRVLGHQPMTLNEAIDRAAASGWGTSIGSDLVTALHLLARDSQRTCPTTPIPARPFVGQQSSALWANVNGARDAARRARADVRQPPPPHDPPERRRD